MTGKDHGMKEVDCPRCNGCGEVVEVQILHDKETGRPITHHWAVTCPACGGNRKVWV